MVKSIAQMQSGKMSKKEMAKMAIGTVICVAADITVTALLGHHVPTLSGWRKWMVRIGTFALAMKVGEETENYFYKVYDETEQAIMEAKDEIDSAIRNDIPKEVEGEVK